jgi:hypothetical protein
MAQTDGSDEGGQRGLKKEMKREEEGGYFLGTAVRGIKGKGDLQFAPIVQIVQAAWFERDGWKREELSEEM